MKTHEKARQPKLFASPIVDGSLSKNGAVFAVLRMRSS